MLRWLVFRRQRESSPPEGRGSRTRRPYGQDGPFSDKGISTTWALAWVESPLQSLIGPRQRASLVRREQASPSLFSQPRRTGLLFVQDLRSVVPQRPLCPGPDGSAAG